MHCTAPGGESERSAAITASGTPMPVMPHAPASPSATSPSRAGRTDSSKRVSGVPA